MTISYPSGGTPIPAELFTPVGASRGAAVVLAHGADGITDHLTGPWATMMRDYATELAQAGFTVLLPNYFEKTETKPGDKAMQTMLVHMPAWQQALADALNYAATQPGIAPGGLALVGFSLGGHLSLRLRGRVRVLVEFFAPYGTGIGSVASGARHVQIHHGEADRLVDVSNAELIATALKDEGVTPSVHTYDGAGHGFNGADAKNTAARKLSKERTLRFVASHL